MQEEKRKNHNFADLLVLLLIFLFDFACFGSFGSNVVAQNYITWIVKQ